MTKIHQIINTQIQYGIDNAHLHKSGLMKVEVDENQEENSDKTIDENNKN